MFAAKSGYVAEFVTGYLQREIRMEVKVANGADCGLRDPLSMGIAVGRLAKMSDEYLVPATDLTDATYIIAQSDDTIRDEAKDYNYPERYSTLPNLIVKNSEDKKTVAVYKIVNVDDVKLVKIAEPVRVLSAFNSSKTFTTGAATYQFIQTGINSFKVIGEAPYESAGEVIVSGNPAGNYLYLKLVNSEIDNGTKFAAATPNIQSSDIVYKRINGIDKNTETKSVISSELTSNGGIEIEVCVNNTDILTIEVMWRDNEWSTYTFDLSELTMEANA